MMISDVLLLTITGAFTAATFYSAGEFMRRRMLRSDTPVRGLRDDLRGLEEAFIDFLASSKTSSRILSLLVEHKTPIGLKALADRLRHDGGSLVHRDEMPLTAVRAVVRILMFARLVRMRDGRFAITELGREVHRRLRSMPPAPPLALMHEGDQEADVSSNRQRTQPARSPSVERSALRLSRTRDVSRPHRSKSTLVT